MKKVIIGLMIILVVSSIIITVILIYMKPQNDLAKNVIDEDTILPDESVIPVENRDVFYTVQQCVEDYLNFIADQNWEAVYELLDQNYCKEKQITKENVKDKVIKVTKVQEFSARTMQQTENTTEITTFIVSGKMRNQMQGSIREEIDLNSLEENDLKLIVVLDFEKERFSILPEAELGQKEINLQLPEGEYNDFYIKTVSEGEVAQHYFNDYRKEILYNKQEAYNLLQEEYRNARFGSVENYIKYVEANIENIKDATVTKYQMKSEKDYRQYVCVDQANNYYMMKETQIGEYTIMLDTYTIALPEYIEKYEKATEQQRVALCIDRFISAVQDENYTFAYSILAQEFKENYFKKQETFEQYCKQNFLGKDKVDYKTFQNQGQYDTYVVSMINSKENINPVQKTFIVKLEEGTNFELSFEV